jgi:hypothetical protein
MLLGQYFIHPFKVGDSNGIAPRTFIPPNFPSPPTTNRNARFQPFHNFSQKNMTQQDDLAVAIMNKIASVLNGGDANAPQSPNSYIAWCRPGIPFQPEDLQFAVKGISGKDGDETRTLVRNAAEFSRVVNAIPTAHIVNQGSYEQQGAMAWDVYSRVLQFSKVAKAELPQTDQDKIKKFRGLMVRTVKVKDIITDEEKEVTQDSPMVQAYNAKKSAYEDASLEYNAKRLAALNADNALAVQDFTLNAGTYRSRVKNALSDWVTNGYKNDFDSINAYINQVSQKDMTLLKADLQDKFEKGKMTDPNSGADFYLSSFYPGNFVNNNKGWTQFTFNTSNKDTYAKDSSSSTSGGGGGGWGLWSASANASTSESTSTKKMDEREFGMEFSLAQVTIGRPWLSPEFLTGPNWKWDSAEMLSNGATPPEGLMPAYPTTAIFVKDIKITSSSMSDFYNEVDKAAQGGGSVGWGPFSVKANHSQSSKEVTASLSSDGKTMTVEGMQLIAFKCFALPNSPHPDKSITSWT